MKNVTNFSNMVIGEHYKVSLTEKRKILKMIQGNGYWNFPNKTRVLGHGGSVFDLYQNDILIKVK